MATTIPTPDITTIVERPTLRIDGVTYTLRHPDELPYLAYRNKAGVYTRVNALFSKAREGDDLSDAEEQELEAILPGLVKSLLFAPDEVLAKLTTEQRVMVVGYFSQLVLQRTSDRIRRATQAVAPPAAAPGPRGPRRPSSKRTRTSSPRG